MQAIEPSKTHRLYLLLKERIVSGVLAPGEQLPGEPALASAHGLSRITVRRALAGLANDGLVQRKPGSGTFVAGGKGAQPVTGDLTDMLAHLAAMGRDTEVRLLSFSHGEPPPAIAEALGLARGERTQQALRVRAHEGKPFSLLSTHVPEHIGAAFGADQLARTPLLTLLEQSGVVADRAVQTITATLAAPEAAAALDVEIGAPLLSLTRVVFDRENRGIEHLFALYRPDRYAFHMELRRAGAASSRYWRAAPSAPPSHRSSRREAPSRRRSP